MRDYHGINCATRHPALCYRDPSS